MDCLFCGKKLNKKENSKEDVIPKWLQKYFNLENQRYFVLGAKREVKYGQLKVPACKECNNSWSRLENRLSNQKASLDDYYLWALKIHIGLIYKDSFLSKNIKNPKSHKIFSYKKNKFYFSFPRAIFEVVKSKSYKFYPSPLGSVILIDKPKIMNKEFDLIHSILPEFPKSICISLQDKYLIVFFEDRNFVIDNFDIEKIINNFKKMKDPRQVTIRLRVLLADFAYEVYRLSLPPLGIIKKDSNIMSLNLLFPQPSQYNFRELQVFGEMLGIKIEKKEKERIYSLSDDFIALLDKK